MAIPTQGGLGQASAAQVKPVAPVQAGGKFDANAVQAENIEELSKSKTSSLRDVVSDELGDQREKMNSALLRMRESLDARKNRLFDPVLMQTAAGFLKKTKSGSFGESLGNAAESASAAAEREMLHEAENQKLEMELLGKEQELRRQMGGDQFMSALFGGSPVNAPVAGGNAPAGNFTPVASSTAPVGSAQKPPSNQQVLSAAMDGKIKITDQVIALADAIDPKKATLLREIRNIQIAEDKNRISQEELDFKRGSDKRKVVPRGLRTEREMNAGEYAKYEAAKAQYFIDGDENKLLDFYDRMGWLESEQVGGRKITPKPADGTSTAVGTSQANGKPPAVGTSTAGEASTFGGTSTVGGTSTAGAVESSTIPRAKTTTQLEEEKSRKELENAIEKKRRESEIEVEASGKTETQKNRAKAAEEKATRLVTQAEAAFENSNIADDMIGYAKNNPNVFNLMNKPGLANAIARAVEQGASVGNFNISLPASTVLQYKLSEEDLTALQMFMQKSAQLQSRGRQLNRTPGEGAISDYETKLLGGIYALPSDSQRAIILKSEALKMQGLFDEEKFKLWDKKKNSMSYDKFLAVDEDFKELKSNYKKALDKVREQNLDLLSPKRKKAESKSETTNTAPVVTAPAKTSEAPKNETYSQRLKRLAEER